MHATQKIMYFQFHTQVYIFVKCKTFNHNCIWLNEVGTKFAKIQKWAPGF